MDKNKIIIRWLVFVFVIVICFGLYVLYLNNSKISIKFFQKEFSNNLQQNNFSVEIKPTEFYAPILMYHHIEKKEPQNSYYVSSEIFREQMQWLKDNNYKVVSYDDFYKKAVGLGELPEKPVIITFDDGVIDQYTNALPILKEFGYTATFFIKLNNVGEGKGGMTWDMIKELIDSGMTIGSHSMNHDNMANMDEKTLKYELTESKKVLEENLDINIYYFCYPGGAYSEETIKATQDAGYRSASTTSHKVIHKIKNYEDLFKIPRIHIDDEIPTFVDWVQGKNLK